MMKKIIKNCMNNKEKNEDNEHQFEMDTELREELKYMEDKWLEGTLGLEAIEEVDSKAMFATSESKRSSCYHLHSDCKLRSDRKDADDLRWQLESQGKQKRRQIEEKNRKENEKSIREIEEGMREEKRREAKQLELQLIKRAREERIRNEKRREEERLQREVEKKKREEKRKEEERLKRLCEEGRREKWRRDEERINREREERRRQERLKEEERQQRMKEIRQELERRQMEERIRRERDKEKLEEDEKRILFKEEEKRRQEEENKIKRLEEQLFQIKHRESIASMTMGLPLNASRERKCLGRTFSESYVPHRRTTFSSPSLDVSRQSSMVISNYVPNESKDHPSTSKDVKTRLPYYMRVKQLTYEKLKDIEFPKEDNSLKDKTHEKYFTQFAIMPKTKSDSQFPATALDPTDSGKCFTHSLTLKKPHHCRPKGAKDTVSAPNRCEKYHSQCPETPNLVKNDDTVARQSVLPPLSEERGKDQKSKTPSGQQDTSSDFNHGSAKSNVSAKSHSSAKSNDSAGTYSSAVSTSTDLTHSSARVTESVRLATNSSSQKEGTFFDPLRHGSEWNQEISSLTLVKGSRSIRSKEIKLGKEERAIKIKDGKVTNECQMDVEEIKRTSDVKDDKIAETSNTTEKKRKMKLREKSVEDRAKTLTKEKDDEKEKRDEIEKKKKIEERRKAMVAYITRKETANENLSKKPLRKMKEYFIAEHSTLTPSADPYDLIEMDVCHSYDWSMLRQQVFGKNVYGSPTAGSTDMTVSPITDVEAAEFYKEELRKVYQITKEEFDMFLNKTQEERQAKLEEMQRKARGEDIDRGAEMSPSATHVSSPKGEIDAAMIEQSGYDSDDSYHGPCYCLPPPGDAEPLKKSLELEFGSRKDLILSHDVVFEGKCAPQKYLMDGRGRKLIDDSYKNMKYVDITNETKQHIEKLVPEVDVRDPDEVKKIAKPVPEQCVGFVVESDGRKFIENPFKCLQDEEAALEPKGYSGSPSDTGKKSAKKLDIVDTPQKDLNSGIVSAFSFDMECSPYGTSQGAPQLESGSTGFTSSHLADSTLISGQTDGTCISYSLQDQTSQSERDDEESEHDHKFLISKTHATSWFPIVEKADGGLSSSDGNFVKELLSEASSPNIVAESNVSTELTAETKKEEATISKEKTEVFDSNIKEEEYATHMNDIDFHPKASPKNLEFLTQDTLTEQSSPDEFLVSMSSSISSPYQSDGKFNMMSDKEDDSREGQKEKASNLQYRIKGTKKFSL